MSLQNEYLIYNLSICPPNNQTCKSGIDSVMLWHLPTEQSAKISLVDAGAVQIKMLVTLNTPTNDLLCPPCQRAELTVPAGRVHLHLGAWQQATETTWPKIPTYPTAKIPRHGKQDVRMNEDQKIKEEMGCWCIYLSCLFSCAARSSSWMFLVICSVLLMTSSVEGSMGSTSHSSGSPDSGMAPSQCQPPVLEMFAGHVLTWKEFRPGLGLVWGIVVVST